MATPVFPSKLTIRFLTRTCATSSKSYPDPNVPDVWTEDYTPQNMPGVYLGVETLYDTALALVDAGTTTPSNRDVLQALENQFATDYLNWRSVSFDQSFAGVAAITPNGLFDIEVTYGGYDDVPATRIITLPLEAYQCQQLGHFDPDTSTDCPDIDVQHVSSRTPGIQFFGPPPESQSSGNTTLDVWEWHLRDGRLMERFIEKVTYPCGCTGVCCIVKCDPCTLPKKNLSLTFTNVISGNQTLTLRYNNINWATDSCVNGLLFSLQCTGGKIEFRAIYFTAGACPTGQQNYCSNLRVSPFSLKLSASTCSPLSLTFDCRSNGCPTLTNSGYTEFVVTDPTPTQTSHGIMCQGFIIKGCAQLRYPNLTVKIYDKQGGTLLDSSVTDQNGFAWVSWEGKPGNYWVVVTGQEPRSLPIAQTMSLSCDLLTTISTTPSPDYACSSCCPDPLKKTLFLTDSAYFAVTLTYDPIDMQWSGYPNVVINFPACNGCPGFASHGSPIQLNYFWNCGVAVQWIGSDLLHPQSCPGGLLENTQSCSFGTTSVTCPSNGVFNWVSSDPSPTCIIGPTIYCNQPTFTITE